MQYGVVIEMTSNVGLWKCLCNFQKIKIQIFQKRHLHSPNNNEKHFRKILIANRGEIACRIISTAKRMGIKTVAVYSAVDSQARHIKLADEAVYLGPSPATQSYLNIEKILEAIKTTGAEAVHPGYGFLSENPNFVQVLENEDITFIGPTSQVIRQMGDKLESKKIAKKADIKTIPGFDDIVKDVEECVGIARVIGYPVMIKASAGGGGKAMRIGRNDEDLREGFKLSTQEAESSFGDSRMLIEKFIENPRHIEIQVLGDKHGNIIHLNERECSIQRRNQKVIEEAPSVFLDESTRKLMGEQAVKLCEKLGYSSAGTVEFLVDQNHDFYFLEMNTRLQVEHPVTEFITGIDLVEQMIRVAKGYQLKITQNDVKINGWAIENRIYAEDPYKNFGLPRTGHLFKYIEPSGVRCDSGVEEGSEISIYYDPLICKLVCHGKSREEAIKRSITALDSYVIRGVCHNIPLLRDILTKKKFVDGDINTNYLSQIYYGDFKGRQLDVSSREKLLAIASALYAMNEARNRQFLNEPLRGTVDVNCDLVINFDNQTFNAIVSQNRDFFTVRIGDADHKIVKNSLNLAQALIKTEINGVQVIMQLVSKNANGEYLIIYQGTCYKLNILSKQAANLLHLMPNKPKLNVSKLIKTPMPGLVKSVSCQIGDEVAEGQELCTIEAMKMQNSMTAATKGKIKSIYIQKGDTVANDDVLVEFE